MLRAFPGLSGGSAGIRAHLSSLSHSLTHSAPPSFTEFLLMSLHPSGQKLWEAGNLVAVFAFAKVLWCAEFLSPPPLPFLSLSCLLLSSFFPHSSLLLLFLLLPPHLSLFSLVLFLPILCITGWAETHYVTNNVLLIFLYFRRCVLP